MNQTKQRTIKYPIMVIVCGAVVSVPPELSQTIMAQFEYNQAMPFCKMPFDIWLVERLKDMFWGDGGDAADRQAEGEYSHSEGAHR